ncbi:MLO protein 1 [Ranunculus cassubicifolius]
MAKAGDRTLEETPTWAVALVCAVFVIISIIIESAIHHIGKLFERKNKKSMSEALEKIKAELMLLGFISLLLTVGTQPITKICIPAKAGKFMLPCKKKGDYGGDKKDDDNKDNRRKLLSLAEDMISRRFLAADVKEDYCAKSGKVALISYSGLHQLHIFIFVLAVFHILYSVILILLGQAKMSKWKSWEAETTSLEYQFTNDPARFRFAHQTSFVKRHTGLSTKPGIRWIVAFFRQFIGSISKVDYLTMRHGFINAHLAPNSKFDFHKYIKRSMEDDFKIVVGISIWLWSAAVLFLLVNVYDWYTLTWISFLPLIIILLVGTKLELIIMEMATQIQDRTSVVKGAPIVEPNNKLFWFNRPEWILYLIQFTLFQNAFQVAYFLWIWYEFGLRSCFHENLGVILLRVGLGVALQLLCSYITFPIYSLVTQMGSHMKQSIFEEHTAKALMKWRNAAKTKKKTKKADASISGFMSGENTPSHGSSPIHLLHKHRSNDIESVMNSPMSYQSDTDLSDTEPITPVSHNIHDARRNESHHKDDFSFERP